MRFDKWWGKVDLDNYRDPDGTLNLHFLTETAWDMAYEYGEMANNEGAYDDGYNQGRADMDAEIDLDALVSEAFLAGHARGHAEGMEASLKELL
jgi:hypothetical protein